jgi:hypothetical protein
MCAFAKVSCRCSSPITTQDCLHSASTRTHRLLRMGVLSCLRWVLKLFIDIALISIDEYMPSWYSDGTPGYIMTGVLRKYKLLYATTATSSHESHQSNHKQAQGAGALSACFLDQQLIARQYLSHHQELHASGLIILDPVVYFVFRCDQQSHMHRDDKCVPLLTETCRSSCSISLHFSHATAFYCRAITPGLQLEATLHCHVNRGRRARYNYHGELLVLSAGSLTYDGNHPQPRFTDAGACEAACASVPGCNAWTWCSKEAGCGSGCSSWVKQHPKCKQKTTIPMLECRAAVVHRPTVLGKK